MINDTNMAVMENFDVGDRLVILSVVLKLFWKYAFQKYGTLITTSRRTSEIHYFARAGKARERTAKCVRSFDRDISGKSDSLGRLARGNSRGSSCGRSSLGCHRS